MLATRNTMHVSMFTFSNFVCILFVLFAVLLDCVYSSIAVMERKRKRSSNFHPAEVRFLMKLVLKHTTILENKKTDSATNKAKDEVWDAITYTYNANKSMTQRSTKTLKCKYDSLKRETRKRLCNKQDNINKSGCEPLIDSLEDGQKILDTLMDIYSDSSDTNGPIVQNSKDDIPDLETKCLLVEVEDSIEIINNETQVNNDEEMLPDSIEEVLIFPHSDSSTKKVEHNYFNEDKTEACNGKENEETTKAGVTEKSDELTSARIQLIELQMEIARKEHLFVQEEHNIRMHHLQNEEKRKQELHEIALRKINGHYNEQTLVSL